MRMGKMSEEIGEDAFRVITGQFGVHFREIEDICALKKGMTNKSFLFSCKGQRYIIRIPGEGTQRLINRKQEAETYSILEGMDICDEVVYINPENGIKITKYLEGARTCNPLDEKDLIRCMAKLRAFHSMKLSANHEFDIFERIDFYEGLWRGKRSRYADYVVTKQNVLSLRDFIEQHSAEKVLTHIDAVPDNFLFYKACRKKDGKQEEQLRLTDWEYAGMQDPHVDVAMFCIYSLYNKQQTDRLIQIYFEGQCRADIRAKIYCYIAACGLLWSNWCEYKQNLGVEFGEYSVRQYQYAKEYFLYAAGEISRRKEILP